MYEEHDELSTTATAGPMQPTRTLRAGTVLLMVATILAGTLAMSGSTANAAGPHVDGYCQSYNGGVFSVGTDGDHLIFMAVEKRTSRGWQLVGYSNQFEWRSTELTHDRSGRKFGAGRYRITAWTVHWWTGAFVGHAPHNVTHWNNSGGYAWSAPTGKAECRITNP